MSYHEKEALKLRHRQVPVRVFPQHTDNSKPSTQQKRVSQRAETIQCDARTTSSLGLTCELDAAGQHPDDASEGSMTSHCTRKEAEVHKK
jgi:hypothetical protein